VSLLTITSKTPFTKWYIKSYTDKYKFNKLIDVIVNNNTDKLNKNLKLEANNLKIIKLDASKQKITK